MINSDEFSRQQQQQNGQDFNNQQNVKNEFSRQQSMKGGGGGGNNDFRGVNIEENCAYCSKCLTGLNDFNRTMHINTCKVRKLVDANRGNMDDPQLDNFVVIGDNCSYCFKSFKDFKSDFNRRIHLKCCKIKKETYDEKNNIRMNLGGEQCVFCTKPLANLNEFNKRMHIENCKIRKSIENNSPASMSKGKKDENLIKLGIELGDNCMYCSKSFVNLSDFNKKLHFEYCKLKKRKLKSLSGPTGSDLLGDSTMSAPQPPSNSGNQSMSMSSGQQQQQNNDEHNKANKFDLGESCLFCSRSLVNLSNFNKRIHIDTCKIKTLKKNTSKMRQTVSSAKSPRKRANKKEKDSNNSSANTSLTNSYCQNLNKSLTLELMGGNLGNVVAINLNHQQQQQLQQLQQQQQQHQMNSVNLQMSQSGNNVMNPFDSLAASLSLSNTLNLTQMTSMNQLQQNKQTMDSNGQYGQTSNGIYI